MSTFKSLVLHDDGEREFDYMSGAEQALERAAESGWTIVSIKNDWSSICGPTAAMTNRNVLGGDRSDHYGQRTRCGGALLGMC